MGRPIFTFQGFGDSFDRHPCLRIGRVDFLGRGREREVGTAFGEFFEVGFKRPRVGVEIFVGAELGWIDEDGNDGSVGFGQRRADETQVAFVKGSHRGNEADSQALFAGGGQRFAEFGNAPDELGHGYTSLLRGKTDQKPENSDEVANDFPYSDTPDIIQESERICRPRMPGSFWGRR